jgi:hypothetical protein
VDKENNQIIYSDADELWQEDRDTLSPGPSLHGTVYVTQHEPFAITVKEKHN